MAIGENVKVAGDRTATLTDARKRTNGPEKVYNFEVWREHNYFVGKEGVLVHNSYPIPINSWQEVVSAAEMYVGSYLANLRSMVRPDAIIGYRGSLATGKKYKSGGDFDHKDWDCDAFIVDDDLAALFPSGEKWRDIAERPDFKPIIEKMAKDLKTLKGYKNKSIYVNGKEVKVADFTFRVFTKAEFEDPKIFDTIYKTY